MAVVGLREKFELETRNKYTKVECEIGMKVDGKELPTMAVLGAALEEAIELIQLRISESYEVVPPRVNEPEPSQITEKMNAVSEVTRKPLPFPGR